MAGKVLKGVGSLDITTDNIELSTEFYTEILGGKLIKQWSCDFKGDEHFRRLFDSEREKSEKSGTDLGLLAVPDISSSGSYQVQWRFILFDNIMVKLVQYSRLDGRVFSARHEHTSSAIVTSSHLCFWLQDVDINSYIRAVENAAVKRGMKNVYFNRALYAESEADRARVPEDQLAHYVNEGDFAPFAMSYFKGPTGEQLELFQLKEPLSATWGKTLYDIGIPSTAYKAGYTNNEGKKNIGITAKLFGMNHFGIRVANLEKSVQFYTQVLGGVLLSIYGDKFRGDAMLNALFQKELLEARAMNQSREALDIPAVYTAGNTWLNVRFVQFGCATVELVEFRQGDDNNTTGYNPRFKSTSPAYCNTIALSFIISEEVNFAECLRSIEADAIAKGFSEFHINALPALQKVTSFEGTDLEGYNYALAKGPSGEQLAFCQFSGKSKTCFHDEIASYGGVSTLFTDLGGIKN